MDMEIDEILKIVKEKLLEQKKKISVLPEATDMYELGTFKGMREIYKIIKELKEI
tara:strand:- start:248 stop:412 length:165 start_codon:yes stop_codon:yes gene_type:complete